MTQNEFKDNLRRVLTENILPFFESSMPVDSLSWRVGDYVDDYTEESLLQTNVHETVFNLGILENMYTRFVHVYMTLYNMESIPKVFLQTVEWKKEIDRKSIWLCEYVTYWDETHPTLYISRYVPFDDLWHIMYQYTREYTIDNILADLR